MKPISADNAVTRAVAALRAEPNGAELASTTLQLIAAALDPIHPDLRAAGRAALAEMASMSDHSAENLTLQRKFHEDLPVDPLPNIPWERIVIPGSGDQPPVTALLINAKPGDKPPGNLHTHGGGFVYGNAMTNLRQNQQIAEATKCVILSVDYRLAPETRFSGSVQDTYTALQWFHAQARDIGVYPTRLATMGESAGGAHTALLAAMARDRGEIRLALQCLIYPMLDDRTGHGGRLVWTGTDNAFGWGSFLGLDPGSPYMPPNSVPARITNLAGLPPTVMFCGTADLFALEAMSFATRLIEAGVQTEFHMIPGAFHGFDLFPEAEPSDLVAGFRSARIAALRRALHE